jgi:adenylylsulfate kinase
MSLKNKNAVVTRSDREALLGQRSFVVWMVGLSGAGKTTLARALEQTLHGRGILTQSLDGDILRAGINADLGFSEEHRLENIRRTAEIARLFANCGIITICSLISPTEAVRRVARSIIGEVDYREVFINCPLEECEKRDVKGLYKKARNGEIKDFTGISAPFEIPRHPLIDIRTDLNSIETCTRQLLEGVFIRAGSSAFDKSDG